MLWNKLLAHSVCQLLDNFFEVFRRFYQDRFSCWVGSSLLDENSPIKRINCFKEDGEVLVVAFSFFFGQFEYFVVVVCQVIIYINGYLLLR